MALLYLTTSGNTISVLYAISIAAIPFTIYSIYYQYFVVKNWCYLCLATIGVLWLQMAIPFASGGLFINEFSLTSIIATSIIFLGATAIWNFVKPKLIELKNLMETKIEFYKFKKNFSLFATLLNKSKQIDTQILETSEIWFGSPHAHLEFIVVTNPFCGHCREVHLQIENILNNYYDKIKICIRFNVNVDENESDVLKITSRLLEIFHKENKETCLRAMNDIYNGMPTEIWVNKWKKCSNFNQYISILKNEKEWCNGQNINFTPEILLNGRSYPREYDRADLVYFIEELIEINEETYNKPQIVEAP